MTSPAFKRALERPADAFDQAISEEWLFDHELPTSGSTLSQVLF
jgi:hypothetical protein